MRILLCLLPWLKALRLAGERGRPALEKAVRVGQTLAESQNRKIFVAGGLFLAVEYAVAAKGGRAKELEFF